MKGKAGDKTTGDEASTVAGPTISEVLAAYLADEMARLAEVKAHFGGIMGRAKIVA